MAATLAKRTRECMTANCRGWSSLRPGTRLPLGRMVGSANFRRCPRSMKVSRTSCLHIATWRGPLKPPTHYGLTVRLARTRWITSVPVNYTLIPPRTELRERSKSDIAKEWARQSSGQSADWRQPVIWGLNVVGWLFRRVVGCLRVSPALPRHQTNLPAPSAPIGFASARRLSQIIAGQPI